MQTLTSDSMKVARRYWGMSQVRGIVAIIFGLLAIFWPHLTFAFFVYIFGVFALVEGCLLIANALSQRKSASNLEGEIYRRDAGYQGTTYQRDTDVPGSATYQRAQPGGTAHQQGGRMSSLLGITHTGWQTLLIEGIVTLAVGVLCFILPSLIGRMVIYAIAAWALFKGIGCLMQVQKRGWVMGLIGVLAIILALVLFFNPAGVIRSAMWLIGLFALVMGVLLLARGVQHNVPSAHRARPTEPSY